MMSCVPMNCKSETGEACANCGKHGSDTVKLKSCTACRLVKYCGVDCQRAHRKQHKKTCKQRAAELKDEELYGQGLERPEGDFCPICTLPIPLPMGEHSGTNVCCMKRVCDGCILAAKKRGMFECPFCRTPMPDNDADELAMIKARVKKKDPEAIYNLGRQYWNGMLGLQKDTRMAVKLWEEAAEFGTIDALFNLGLMYFEGMEVQQDKEKGIQLWKKAAMQGHVESRHSLGANEVNNANYDRALNFLAASYGVMAQELVVAHSSVMERDPAFWPSSLMVPASAIHPSQSFSGAAAMSMCHAALGRGGRDEGSVGGKEREGADQVPTSPQPSPCSSVVLKTSTPPSSHKPQPTSWRGKGAGGREGLRCPRTAFSDQGAGRPSSGGKDTSSSFSMNVAFSAGAMPSVLRRDVSSIWSFHVPGHDSDEICSNCGKQGSDTIKLKSCTACRLVKYCGVDCQRAHRKQHKKACKQRAAELKDEQLYKGRERPEGDFCPICTLPIPIPMGDNSSFNPCCMKRICNGCSLAASKRGMDGCVFCRTPFANNNADLLAMIRARVKKKDPEAMNHLGEKHWGGGLGLQKDSRKAVELYAKAAELGSIHALFNLGNAYENGDGVQQDTVKAAEFYEEAAMQGWVEARHNLAGCEVRKGNSDRAVRHLLISAKMGDKDSVDNIKRAFKAGVATKEHYAEALKGYQDAVEEMKSYDRDEAKRLGHEGVK
ncbi:hypothetical protein THAOC_08966 [Thalassiosira oceanica]|uniref:MYND-type domain-containing protein n=1 Tax=Thalassiosira oceanica TaxID=159749 RepID=K0SWE9_THAOC|nr:hypothetical protein THAOC_08966 [Thalassiosira oceanica]|eukprot:EJK69745.1 hypothetical protein THAOC_08966 [Thalassiosira oceanica]